MRALSSLLCAGLLAGHAAAESVTLTPVKDSDVYTFLSRPTGTTLDLGVSNSPSTLPNHSQKSLIQFNLAALAIPAGEIGSAVLRLYSLPPDSSEGGTYRPGNILLFRQGAAWGDVSIAYPNTTAFQPTGAAVATLAMGEGMVNQWVEVDVTALVTAWAAGTAPNYGVILQCEADPVATATTNVLFGSMEFGEYARLAGLPDDQQPFPRLVITRASPPAEPAASPVLHISAASEGQLTLQWPVNGSTGWTLESAPDLAGPWAPSSATATSVDGQWQVVMSAVADREFFRLKK